MDKNAAAALDALDTKIESLQAKREAVLKKESERKARAQEKWKGVFLKEMIKAINATYGEDYEEIMLPEECAAGIGGLLRSEHEETLQETGQAGSTLPDPSNKPKEKGETDDE